jgi:excisionase family DNA binding protein
MSTHPISVVKFPRTETGPLQSVQTACASGLANGKASGTRYLLTIPEVADELRLSKTTILRLIAGEVPNMPGLPSIRIGRRVLIRREALIRFTEQAEKVNSTE